MANPNAALKLLNFDEKTNTLLCQGDWIIAEITELKNELNAVQWPAEGEMTFDGKDIAVMDSAGAWLITHWQKQLSENKRTVQLANFSEQHQKLLQLVQDQTKDEKELTIPPKPRWLAQVGHFAMAQVHEMGQYLAFIGRLAYESLRLLKGPKRMRWSELAHVIYVTGYQALPIVGLLSFMIGVVIAYQMGAQLKNYGANVFLVTLLGLSVLREFGPLLSAILVAGRTGSAFTAQIGTMKINQEVDALNTMGVTPAELLLLPRILGLLIAMPLLAIWADLFGIFGGMLMANTMFGITPYDFVLRFESEIPVRALLIGLGKSPVFALLIGTIGCFQGMLVAGSADSVGKQTTRSVVLSIFFIIVVDAMFSIIFSRLKL